MQIVVPIKIFILTFIPLCIPRARARAPLDVFYIPNSKIMAGTRDNLGGRALLINIHRSWGLLRAARGCVRGDARAIPGNARGQLCVSAFLYYINRAICAPAINIFLF